MICFELETSTTLTLNPRILLTDMTASTGHKLLVITPVFNDWECLDLILPRIDSALSRHDAIASATVLVIDDASTKPASLDFDLKGAACIDTVKVLRLRRNLGHQRAIGIGLTYAQDKLEYDIVVVMDADGEDRPEDIPRLIDELIAEEYDRIVFAERGRRTESSLFQFFYHAYRLIHRVLTGIPVRVGNFSVIPARHMQAFAVISETWSHYAAAIYAAGIPRSQIPIARGDRLAGKPTMNFTALVMHGLSALAVHGAVIGVRMLIASSGVLLLSVLTTLGVTLDWMMHPSPESELYSITGVFFSFGMFFMTLFIFGLNLIILNNRTQLGFLPARDYKHFIDSVHDHVA